MIFSIQQKRLTLTTYRFNMEKNNVLSDEDVAIIKKLREKHNKNIYESKKHSIGEVEEGGGNI